MNDKEIQRCLRMMGMRCFVRFFGVFTENIERIDMARRIWAEQNRQHENGEPVWEPWGEGWDFNSVLTLRVSPALKIIRSGSARRALEMVRDSARLPAEDRQRAEKLLRCDGHVQQDIGSILHVKIEKMENPKMNQMNKKMEQINRLWQSWCVATKELSRLLGSRNIVGQYAEALFACYLSGTLAATSEKSYDLLGEDGKRYQIKARKVARYSTTTQLGIIRSWDFDFLATVLFDEVGNIILATISPVDVAKKYAKQNDYQRGWVITTTREFWHDPDSKDVAAELSEIVKQGTA